MKGKIINEISINEMRELRESGMTNQEIVASLDISYQTVVRHIGKQPSGYRGQTSTWAIPKNAPKAPEETPTHTKPPIKFVDERIVTRWESESGKMYEADIDMRNGKIEISANDGDMIFEYATDDAFDLASFIVSAANRAKAGE